MPQDSKLAFAVWLSLFVFGIANIGSAETLTRQGVHLRLTSDVADERLLEDLVASFDAAVPQWLAFWGLPAERAANWSIDGFLMRDADAFRRSGDLPNHIPRFKNGFATPKAVWVNYQSSAYYNRHLMLHEGVHALTFELFGGGGPSWYMEGTAELLGTHRNRPASQFSPTSGAADGLLAQAGSQFRINELPRSREESAMWGRYRVIDEQRQTGSFPTLASVMKLPTDLEGNVESYTWCWAAALMFTSYRDTRDAYISAAQRGRDQSPAFTTRFFREIGGQWPALRARWQLWLHDLEYGFDRQRYQVDLSTDDPRYDEQPKTFTINSGLGWQSAGAWFPGGTIQIRASGQCAIVAKENLEAAAEANHTEDAAGPIQQRDWISTPGGITVHYHRGYPIGQLQVCVLPIPSADVKKVSPLEILPVTSPPDAAVRLAASGVSSATEVVRTVQIDRPSWLLFRIHDAPGEDGRFQRADNRGGYQIQISR
ncbi:hypothetical protein [Aporhodopirellula aestuarii]|uniref:DUF1570 domain-containing protein n=1 Tax=Aporhodopirellula aestuarii TaxID=2950107 RepID=A0ABT0U4A8_9BACT|nr:hypothetical protein [Aporhodopirellula aestuarii]MCM2371687.1 hypothetical protein [Aporhodopirellula aestuarii]